ncbi:MAG: hypothetical protein ACK5RV_11200 [Flavobacterium sp.]|jgi:hypothetical protein|uniref:hypothetical protein n=1 Tax=Flavobacterium sp. TaxID=239 RepID=UPI0022C1C64F|nr:hypothetical protein [Flavobacterium sp.]MCZ8169671.1 hypothetical protein [Flavobacterium sp.]MCZ8297968.1 hypothetical protein [Flavobacterium sp.]
MVQFIITIASLLLTSFSFSQVNTGIESQGKFNGKRCDIGRGLCTITAPTSNASSTMKNFITYKQSENTLVIELEATKLSIDDQKLIFGKEYSKMTKDETLRFEQTEDYVFDLDTLIYLGFDVNFKYLKKGTYPISIVKDKVLVTLTLSKQ